MFTAALAFFQHFVCPAAAPATSADDSAGFLARTMPRSNATRQRDLERRHGARAAEVGAVLLPGGVHRRRDLLLECCAWRKGADGELIPMGT